MGRNERKGEATEQKHKRYLKGYLIIKKIKTMSEENLNEANKEDLSPEKSYDPYKKAVDLTSEEETDWEQAEKIEAEEEAEEERAELEKKQKQLEAEKAEQEKIIGELDPITKIKLEHNFTDDEKSYLLLEAKTKQKPLKEIMSDDRVLNIIQIHRKATVKPIPNVLGENREDKYLSSEQFKNKLNKTRQDNEK